ncbi:MAG: glycosyltransferase family 4 protein [Chloroflexota bacterium]
MSLTIWQIDPASLTPYYDLATCDALAQAGARVRFVTTRFFYDENLVVPGSFETDYLYFRRLNYRWIRTSPQLRKLTRAMQYPINHLEVLRQARHRPPDLIHMQWSRLPGIDRWFLARLKAQGLPIVHTVHNIVQNYNPDADTQAFAPVYRLADRLIVHTEANRQEFQHIYPDIPAERLRIVPMIESGTPGRDRTQQAARAQLNLPDDAVIVLFFGAIRPYKGLDILLRAWQQIDNPDALLLIAGQLAPGDPAPDVDRASIRARFGFIPSDSVWAYHMAADVEVLPYRQITQSAALITAMGYGRPVIVSDIGGMPETIDGNGWIVPPEDPGALADALRDALSDRQRLTAMGQQSRAIIDTRHNPQRVAEAHLRIYRELI